MWFKRKGGNKFPYSKPFPLGEGKEAVINWIPSIHAKHLVSTILLNLQTNKMTPIWQTRPLHAGHSLITPAPVKLYVICGVAICQETEAGTGQKWSIVLSKETDTTKMEVTACPCVKEICWCACLCIIIRRTNFWIVLCYLCCLIWTRLVLKSRHWRGWVFWPKFCLESLIVGLTWTLHRNVK